MKKPDNDTLTILYCLFALGVVSSFTLSRFAGVAFFHSVWITVPTFLVVGMLALRWWLKSIERKIAKAASPLQVRNIAGIGDLQQLPEYWAVELEVVEEMGAATKIHVTIAADSRGPSERQLALVRTLKDKYAQLKPILLKHLEAIINGGASGNILEKVKSQEVSYDIGPDHGDDDLEVTFPDKDGPDLVYVVCVKDWRVVDVYGAD